MFPLTGQRPQGMDSVNLALFASSEAVPIFEFEEVRNPSFCELQSDWCQAVNWTVNHTPYTIAYIKMDVARRDVIHWFALEPV